MHYKNDLPRVDDLGFVIGPGTESRVGVNFISYRCTSDVGYLEVGRRDCYVDADPQSKLKYFSTYTISGCFMEDEIEQDIQKCGCRPTYFTKGDHFILLSLKEDCSETIMFLVFCLGQIMRRSVFAILMT